VEPVAIMQSAAGLGMCWQCNSLDVNVIQLYKIFLQKEATSRNATSPPTAEGIDQRNAELYLQTHL